MSDRQCSKQVFSGARWDAEEAAERAAKGATEERMRKVAASLGADTYWTPQYRGGPRISESRVVIDIERLQKLVTQSKVLDELVSAGLVDEETVAEVSLNA
jgi:hypothetical protein